MKTKYTIPFIALLGAFTSLINPAEVEARCQSSHQCHNCPIDIRQGPGFWELDNHNPLDEVIFDDDPMNFDPNNL